MGSFIFYWTFIPSHRILLVSNFLRLDIEEGRCIYEYNVKFNPAVDSARERENLIHQLREVLGERKERNFDCGATLYLPKRLPQRVRYFYVCKQSLKRLLNPPPIHPSTHPPRTILIANLALI